VIELYAITDRSGPPLPDGRLRAVAAGELAAVCAPASDEEVTADALWRHEGVVEALMRDRDLLPVRYGTRLESEEAAARAVEERGGELSAALDRIRGAVELSVRVLAEHSPPAPQEGVSGAEYLQAKALQAAESRAAERAVHEPLSGVARASVKSSPRPGEMLRAAYLVDRGSLESFVALVARLEQADPALRIVCTGPWPPYSFAER